MQEKIDKQLNELAQFEGGSQDLHKVLPWGKQLVTDGVLYVMENGYSWLITDALIAIAMKPKLRQEPFLTVHLKLKDDKTARLEITDGGKEPPTFKPKVLYRQKYCWTDAQRELVMYYEDGVLMLTGER